MLAGTFWEPDRGKRLGCPSEAPVRKAEHTHGLGIKVAVVAAAAGVAVVVVAAAVGVIAWIVTASSLGEVWLSHQVVLEWMKRRLLRMEERWAEEL